MIELSKPSVPPIVRLKFVPDLITLSFIKLNLGIAANANPPIDDTTVRRTVPIKNPNPLFGLPSRLFELSFEKSLIS